MSCYPTMCQSSPTKEHALENIKDVIKLCLEVRAERGLPLTMETSRGDGVTL
jgi:predicted RNase H-like HicB family nuclease